MSAIDRQMNILEFTLSSLLRRKGRNAALLVVYTIVVAMLASVMFFTRALRDEASHVLQGAPEIVVQRTIAGRHELVPPGYAGAVSRIRGVREVRPRLWGYYFDPAVGANYTVIVPTGIVPEGSENIREGEVTVGSALSRARKAYVGDVFPFRTHDGRSLNLRIAALLPQETELVSADLVLMSAADFGRLFGFAPGMATDLEVRARNPRELATIATKITEALPDARPIIRAEVARTYDALFDWRGAFMSTALMGALLAFVIFAWDRASGLSAEEKREIGILKAVGWETSDVLGMKMLEGAVVSLTAFLLGTALAYLHVFFMDSSLFLAALKGWSVLYPSFTLTPAVDAYELVTLFFMSVVPYTAAAAVPSWRAAIADPDTVMREE